MPRNPFKHATVTNETTAQAAAPALEPANEAIASLAYQLWLERGRPEGSPEQDWFRAQDLLRAGHALTASSTSN
jgi:hypothetical protein